MKSHLAVFLLGLVILLGGLFFWRDFIAPSGFQIENARQTVVIDQGAEAIAVNFLVSSASAPTTVTSVDADCDCAGFDDLPLLIPANEERYLTAVIDVSRVQLPARRMFLFYLNPPPREQHVAIVDLVRTTEE